MKHIATTSMTGTPRGSDFTIASTVVNRRIPPVAIANGTAGRAWSVMDTGCIAINSIGFFPVVNLSSACPAMGVERTATTKHEADDLAYAIIKAAKARQSRRAQSRVNQANRNSQ